MSRAEKKMLICEMYSFLSRLRLWASFFLGKSETCNHHGDGADSGVDEWGACLPRGISGNKRGSSVSENDTP